MQADTRSPCCGRQRRNEDDCSLGSANLQETGLAEGHWRGLLDMKKRRTTEEDGDPSSIKPLSKLKMRKLNASEGEEESKAINPEPKAEKDNKITKNKKKEKVKNVERGVKEEKDSYLSGQRHDTPHERDPFRIFLETLYQRIPENELAASWMIEWGLLSSDEAKQVCDKMLEKNLHGQLESANSGVADARTSTLSEGNLDFVHGTVSKAKKQKVHKTSSNDAISDLNSRKKKRKNQS